MLRVVVNCVLISVLVTGLAMVPVFMVARHEEHQVIAGMKGDVVELYSVNEQATGLTQRRSRPKRDRDLILEIDSDPGEDEAEEVRPRRIRQRLFDGSRIEAIGRGMLWLAGGVVAISLAATFGLSRLNNAMNRTGL